MDSAEEAKRMKKAKKEAEQEKEADKKQDREAWERHNRFSGGYGSYRDRESWSSYSRFNFQRPQTENRYCFNCQRVRHMERNCPRNLQN